MPGNAPSIAYAGGLGHTRAMPPTQPFSAACERNREPILGVLRDFFADRRRVLEVGSGSGQHAVHFAAAMPWLEWQASDRADALPGLRAWLDDAALPNTPPPLVLDAGAGPWPPGPFDAFFSANTLHIMAWPEVEALFAALPACAGVDAKLALYGPFHRDGHPTSDGNAAFDAGLKARAPYMGLRDVAAVDALARRAGFAFVGQVAMPANNLVLRWRRA